MPEFILYPLAAIGALTVVASLLVAGFLLFFGARKEAP